MRLPFAIGAVVDGVPSTFHTPLSGQLSPVLAVVPSGARCDCRLLANVMMLILRPDRVGGQSASPTALRYPRRAKVRTGRLKFFPCPDQARCAACRVGRYCEARVMTIMLERECLSVDEARSAFLDLDDDALCDIYSAAGRLTAASPFFDEPSDLVHQTLRAILDSNRRVPRSANFTAAFIMDMKSIAFHEAKRAERFVPLVEFEDGPSCAPSPERLAGVSGIVRKLREAFQEDEAVNAILMAYEEDKSLREIGEILGIEWRDLEAGRKRVARWAERQGLRRHP